MSNASIRLLSVADLPKVCEIEALSYPFPWTDTIFSDCIRVGYLCRGLMLADQLIGYSVFSMAAGEGHILNLTVAPEHRHSGHGRAMLHDLLVFAGEQDLSRIFLEVRPSNRAARALYESQGFELIGLRHDYYRGEHGREDAMVYALTLGAPNSDQPL